VLKEVPLPLFLVVSVEFDQFEGAQRNNWSDNLKKCLEDTRNYGTDYGNYGKNRVRFSLLEILINLVKIVVIYHVSL
jgi:hypothetical protein